MSPDRVFVDGVPSATDDDAAIARLAARYGIEPEYDHDGRRIAVPIETQKRLLIALGADVAAPEAELRRLDEEEWARALPRVAVDRSDGRAVGVEVTLPAGTERFAYRLTLEEGTAHCDEVAFGGLDLVAAHEHDGLALERRRLPLGTMPLGYHRLALNEPGEETALIAAPGACFLPEAARDGRRTYGLAAQLNLVRSDRNWGIGDLADLGALVNYAADHGADLVGISPLHALFLDAPEAASPYSPASRLLLNPLYVALDRLPGADGAAEATLLADPAFAGRVEAARASPLVDYAAVAALKMAGLTRAHAAFRDGADEARRADFERYRESRGDGFGLACLFLALRAHFAAEDPPRPDWRDWPVEYRSPAGLGTLRFLEEEPAAVEFQHYVQFVVDEQLGAAADRARAGGMTIGLYRDLAVGADRGGAETWGHAEAVIRGVTVGAPPDLLGPAGQDWDVPPFHPRALRDEAYASFIEIIRANMRHAGALRIDHVMGLKHLWCVPEGSSPTEGAYLTYPLDDLVGVLALESVRNRCLVVGEDLGTVPPGFRERLAEAGLLSYRVLLFEQDFATSSFTAPEAYPAEAVAVTGSHDLPTLRGWWRGRDIAVKDTLGLYPQPGESARQEERRRRERETLTAALRDRGLLDAGELDEDAFALAATAYLSMSRSALALVQLDDLTGEVEPVNVPGTFMEHPNWRRKYRLTLEELATDARAERLMAAMRGRKG